MAHVYSQSELPEGPSSPCRPSSREPRTSSSDLGHSTSLHSSPSTGSCLLKPEPMALHSSSSPLLACSANSGSQSSDLQCCCSHGGAFCSCFSTLEHPGAVYCVLSRPRVKMAAILGCCGYRLCDVPPRSPRNASATSRIFFALMLVLVSSSLPAAPVGRPSATPRLGVVEKHLRPGTRNRPLDDICHECTVRLKTGESLAPWQRTTSKDAMPTHHCCCKFCSKQLGSLLCISPDPERSCSPSSVLGSLQASHTQDWQRHCSLCLHLCG